MVAKLCWLLPTVPHVELPHPFELLHAFVPVHRQKSMASLFGGKIDRGLSLQAALLESS